MRAIVVDTTTLQRRSTELKGFYWQLVLNAAHSGNVLLAVPEVCLLEANRQVQKSLAEALEDLSRTAGSIRLNDVSNALKSFQEGFQVEANAAAAKFIQDAKDRIGQHSGRVLPLPDVPHAVIIQKELEFVKPYSEDGSGYRDTLIWHSLLELIRSEPDIEELFFVTNNISDFAVSKKNKNKLAENLIAEAKEIKGSLELHLVNTLKDLDELLDLTGASQAEVIENDESARFNVDLTDAVERAAGDVLWSDFDILLEIEEAPDIVFPDWFERPVVALIEIDTDTLTYFESEIVGSNETVVVCEVHAEISVESAVFKGEMHSIPDDYWISDGDLNDHYGEVQTTLSGKLQFNALISPDRTISLCTLIGLIPS